MNQDERLDYLIETLIAEQPRYGDIKQFNNIEDRKKLFRSLINVRLPLPIDNKFLSVQNEYLKEELSAKGIVDIVNLVPVKENIHLWQGDITRLKVDAIVNAANSSMLGCFIPCHNCIDNQIHTNAGVQLREACAKIMNEQGHEERTGTAKITPAYNLPCHYVLHTVGPIIQEKPTKRQCEQLENCYRSCLELADSCNLKSIAFCCISTGEFHFPNLQAAEIAIQTVTKHLTKSKVEVIFNVFKENDYSIYKKLLGAD